MAHIVNIPDPNSTNEKKPRKSIKEVLLEGSQDKQQERREDMKEKLEQQREKAKEAETAKRRLRIIATQKCKTDQETVAALQRIAEMSPDEALSTLDLYLAKADASFVDRIAMQIRRGLGAMADLVARAEGNVSARFNDDNALHECLVKELGFAASFINNKTQIALCCATDTIGGYSDASAKKKVIVVPKEQDKAKTHTVNVQQTEPIVKVS